MRLRSRPESPKPFCDPIDSHTWVAVVGGEGYSEDFDTWACIKCSCFTGIRRYREKPDAEPKHAARPPHPDTMAGR